MNAKVALRFHASDRAPLDPDLFALCQGRVDLSLTQVDDRRALSI
ncbi:hypothetical protein CHELA17_65263 [Chelatococcus asaccharovorans]|nr:hypothetical protein CHELA17_65263 [Chelatococcus asaccharovorans]